ncbi:hypothetical protein [Mesorhizobium sp. M0802]|uniref:hypothetical protein n=1 Tax=Mesorhizobium sp. M0802 TaxID=2957001 RepID=UPI0033360B64
MAAFANFQRRKRGAEAKAANLPQNGGDVRQDRGGAVERQPQPTGKRNFDQAPMISEC